MDFDVYLPCPCGSGKKIKFCCVNDLLQELGRILRSIEARQTIAAMDQIDRITAAKGARPAFLILKAELLLTKGDIQEMVKTINLLLPEHAKNPNVTLFRCIGAAGEANLKMSLDFFQEANALDARIQSPNLWEYAISILIDFFRRAHLHSTLYALSHLRCRLNMESEQDQEMAIQQVNAALNTQLIVRYPTKLSSVPEDSKYKAKVDEAIELTNKGCWRQAAELLEGLNVSGPETETVLMNIARLRGWLVDSEAATAAWRKLAAIPNLPEETAIECEALAQYLGDWVPIEKVDDVNVTIEIKNVERLLERLHSSRRALRANLDASNEPDEVPPKAAFVILNRDSNAPTPSSPKFEDVTRALTTIEIYGRETDREARLMYSSFRTDDFQLILNTLADVCGDSLAGIETRKEEADEQIDKLLAFSVVQPIVTETDDTTYDEVRVAVERRRLLDVWPTIRTPVLNNKSPLQAASDPSLKTKLQAAILCLESEVWHGRVNFDCNELRRKLGVPELRKVAFGVPPANSHVALRLPRMELSIVPDDMLLSVIKLANEYGISKTVYDASVEMLRRPAGNIEPTKSQMMVHLVTDAPNSRVRLKHLREIQEHLAAIGRPLGLWKVHEIELLITMRQMEEASKVMAQITNKYGNDAQVMRALAQVLHNFGLLPQPGQGLPSQISPRQAIPGQSTVGPAMPGQFGPGGHLPVSAGQAESNLWTADAPAASASSTHPASRPAPQKSKLWLPGMD